MKTKLALFLSSSSYRKMIYTSVGRRIRNFVLWPIMYVRAWIKAKRFLKEHPDNWERFVEMKKMEEEINENDRLYKLTEHRMKLKSNLTLMQISMLTNIAKNDPLQKVKNAKEVSTEEIKKQFEDYKQKALDNIEACKKLGAVMPDELTVMIQGCTYDACESVPELRAFSEALCKQLEEFDFGKVTD